MMLNDCISVGLENNVSSVKRLSLLSYRQLKKYDIASYYKLCAISHAAGILANRKKSIGRGLKPRNPYSQRPFMTAYYGFRLEDGMLKVPLGNREYFDIQLNSYVAQLISDPSLQMRSFILTPDAVSICYSKEVTKVTCVGTVGVDRNLRNLTVGNRNDVVHYDLSKAEDIANNTRSIMRSFKRNDARVRQKLYAKYGKRRKNRIRQMLHRVSKAVVQEAKESQTALVFEGIHGIRRLYKRGNGQGRPYRGAMNAWPFAEIKRQIGYKAAWEGLSVIQLSIKETRGTSQLCPQCGKRITQADRRMLYCAECKYWMDRDVLAAMNISIRGRSRFDRSQGAAGEAMRGNPTTPVILRVNAAKLTCQRKLASLTEPPYSSSCSSSAGFTKGA